ncbi:hypothetical protein D3C77_729410 [compost metagenome]
MVQHLHILQAKLGILVLQRVERMWTGRYNFTNTVFVKSFDILHTQLLEYEFITEPSRSVAGIPLLIAKNGKACARLLQETNERFRYFAAALIIRTHRPDEK